MQQGGGSETEVTWEDQQNINKFGRLNNRLHELDDEIKIAKDNQKSSFIGKAGAVGLEKAVEVLDTLGSSMSNLNARSGFGAGMASRGNRISILAFEVANTIAKGANLFQSLSEENVQFLKKEILHSEGVQQLVSADMKELLIIAATDKREEFDVFAGEVIRFGDLCKDPQWHNLGRYFSNYLAQIFCSIVDLLGDLQFLAVVKQYLLGVTRSLLALAWQM